MLWNNIFLIQTLNKTAYRDDRLRLITIEGDYYIKAVPKIKILNPILYMFGSGYHLVFILLNYIYIFSKSIYREKKNKKRDIISRFE